LKEFSFLKEERIRKGSDFRFLKMHGKVFKTKSFIFNFMVSEQPTKIGFIVTKKVGNSVFRSKVKRWLREVFRTNKQELQISLKLVIVPRRSELSWDLIKRDFLFFTRWINEKVARNID
jgi:ribonuclease P protein component